MHHSVLGSWKMKESEFQGDVLETLPFYPKFLHLICFKTLRMIVLPWLVWLRGLSAGLRTKGSPVQFPVRAHAWVVGQDLSRGRVRGNHTLMFLFLPLPHSLHLSKNKQVALAGVAQGIRCQPVNQRVTGSVPGQGTCLGCGPGPQ